MRGFTEGSAGADAADHTIPATFAALARRPEAHPTDPVAVYLAGLAPSGRVTVARRLVAVARLLGVEPERVPWAELRSQHVIVIRARLLEGGTLAPATVNLTLAALRGVARAAWRLGLLTAEELAQIRDVPPARGSRLPAGRSATGGELAALLAACGRDPAPAGVRDGALLALLYGAGLRRAELAGLGRGNWLPAARLLRVLGKGDKQREVPLPPGAVAALEDLVGRPRGLGRAAVCPHQQGGAARAAAHDGAGGLWHLAEARRRGGRGRPVAPRPAPDLRGRPPRPRRGHRHRAEARGPRRREHHRPLRPARRRGPARGGGPPPRPLRAAAAGLSPGQRIRLRVRKQRMPTTPQGHRHPLVQFRSRARHLAMPRRRCRRPTPARVVRLVRLPPVTGIPAGVSAAGAPARC